MTGAVSYCFNSIGDRAAVMHRHLPAAFGQRQRDFAAEPPGGAGDKDNGS